MLIAFSVGNVWGAICGSIASSIAAGDEVVLVNTGETAELTGVSSSIGQQAAYSNGTPAGTCILTVEAGKSGTGTFSLKMSNNNYLAYTQTGSGNNKLYTISSPSTNDQKKQVSWTISIDVTTHVATITNVYNTARKLMFNSDRFCCYTSNQTPVKFFKKSACGGPTVTPSTESLDFGTVAIGETPSPATKTFSITGSDLTGNLSISADGGYTISPTSVPASGTLSETNITVTPPSTATAGLKEGTITISGGGLSPNVTVSVSMLVEKTYDVNCALDFATIGSTGWSNSYQPHTVSKTGYEVVFAAASKQTGTITDIPVAKNTSVDLKLTDTNLATKYISAVKVVCRKWNTNSQTISLQYSVDGGETYTAFSPAVTSTTFTLEKLDLPAKVNALRFAASNNSQIGYASVHFDLVDKQTYTINKVVTGCTLSVTNGTSAITSAEAGDEVYVSITGTTEGYEDPVLTVKDADNITIPVTNGKFTMPAKAVTVTAAATKKQYTVTLAATNGEIQVGGVDKTSIDVEHGDEVTLLAVADDDYAFQNWASEDFDIASPSNNPLTITIAKAGTITANFISTAKLNPGFAWSDASAVAVKGQEASLPTLTTNPYSLTPTYVSTNTDVAEINNAGEVTIKAVGSTTIKATYAEDPTYAACEATYTLTVKGRVTWHIIKEGVDATSYADYSKDAVPTKPVGVTSCDASISLVGWTTSTYAKSDDAPTPLYTENVPAVTDNADYYAVWANVEEGGWNEITSVANLTAGTYAICSDYYFMKAVKVDSKNRLQNGGEPSISEGKLTSAPAADCQWTISINGDGKYLFQNGDKYAIATSTKNEMILSSATDIAEDAHAQWEIARSGSIFEVTNIGRAGDSDTPANKYLRNNTTSGWACYSSNQGGEGYAPRFFKYSAGSATGYTTNCVPPMTVATPTFTPDGSAAYYTEAQSVTINCATEGSVIYYTLDNTTPSKTNGTQYTAAINVAETKTIKAIAYVGDVASEVAEATFTINLPLTTIQGIFDEATAIGSSAAQERIITFNSWVVSAIGSDEKSVYVTDGEKGFVIYGAEHGFAVGNILSGTVTCNLQLFGGFAEIKGMKYNAQGLHVTTGGTLNPQEVSLKNLSAINTGAPIIINNVTYDNDGDLVDAESYYATPVEWLYTFETSTFETNKIYKVTGIYIYGSNSDKIVPRDADDIVKLTKEQPTLTWKINDTPIGESYSIDNKDVPFAPVCVANSTGSKSYESSNTSVATIDENGVLTVIGNGVTTITCTVAEDDDYVEGSKSFTLKVGVYDATWVAATWATAESVASNTKMADKSPIAIDANLSMTWSKAGGSNDPIYHSDGEGRLYQKNTLTITASNSKQITRIEFHFTGTSTGTISVNEGTYSAGVWTGFAPSVTFTNAPSASGAKIKSIDIEYAQGTTTTLEIEDMVILDNASATDIVFSSNKPGAVVTYSDYDEGVINIAEGKVTPVAIGNTTVKASIAAEAPYSSVSITFNVRVKSSSETVENVVILSQFGEGWIAMKHDFTAVEVEKAADGTILDLTCDEEDITWVMTADGASAMFQQPSTNKYLAVGSSNALTLVDDPTTWTLSDDGYYYNVSGRTFLYQGTGAKYKNYSANNHGKSADGGYSEYATFVTPVFANRAEIRTAGITSGVWGTICPKKEVKYPTGASFFEISYVEYHSGVPYKVFYDEIAEGASLAAGHPYLFQADEESTAIKGIAVGDDAIVAINDHGFKGVLENETISVVTADVENYRYYIVYNNEIRLCGEGQFLIRAERAYLDMSDPNVEKQYKAPINGRRRVALTNNAPQVATGIDALNASDAPVKVLIDGQLFILRGEKMFDAKGQLVK